MIVVSDTTPLNYLILIEQIELLPQLFNRVLAPPEVVKELLHPNAPTLVAQWASTLPAWLEIAIPKNLLQFDGLDAGESEAISLAKQFPNALLLIDDLPAKQIAIRHQIKATGTLGILEMAANQGLVDLAAVIAALRKTSFRCTSEVIDDLLIRHQQHHRKADG